MDHHYLVSIKSQFEYYKMLGEKTFAQLEASDLFWQYNEESNSIAIIVHHLWGNMRSRWTDFVNTDGEKEWRQRDLEFENVIKTKEELMDKWEQGWSVLFRAIDSIPTDGLDTIIYIRNKGHTVVEAINRQMAHYAYHIGQIVYIGKLIKASSWESLSIPKGKSKDYNDQQFSQPRRKEHFSKEFLEGVG